MIGALDWLRDALDEAGNYLCHAFHRRRRWRWTGRLHECRACGREWVNADDVDGGY